MQRDISFAPHICMKGSSARENLNVKLMSGMLSNCGMKSDELGPGVKTLGLAVSCRVPGCRVCVSEEERKNCREAETGTIPPLMW